MIELTDIRDFVVTWPPFDRISENELQRLCSAIEVSYQPVNTELLGFDTTNTELYLIRKGAVGLFEESGRLIDKRAEGGLFGYPSLLTGRPTQLAARTLEDTLVYHIPGEEVRKLRTQNSRFDQYFLTRLADRVTAGLKLRSGDLVTSKSVAAFMSSPAVSIERARSIGDAASRMTEKGVSALTIIDGGVLCGILTDRDFRKRVVNRRLSYDASLQEAMTPDPCVCDVGDNVLQAQIVMLERGVHHLPVVETGKLVGMLTLSDVLRAQNQDPVCFIGDLRRSRDAKLLAETAKKRFALFSSLVEGGVDSVHILRVMTAITDATTSRLIALAESELGPAPMKYAWICLGSQARREQTVRTDQDNGLVFEREPEQREAQYFERLATMVCTGLNEAGFVFCPGNVMAMNPVWRMSVQGWQNHFDKWITEPEPEALMFAAIFFDQRCVAGDSSLVSQVRKEVFEKAKKNSIFLAYMAGNALEQRPPMSFFRRFILEDDGEHQEGLNLKHRGVVPIVALARFKALEMGIEDPDTVHRLKLIGEKGGNREDASDLLDALDLINRIRIAEQSKQMAAGEEPTNLVPPNSLSPLTRRHLKAAFSVVRRAQQNISRNFSIE